jgi:excisionase family DNA binding protein
MTAAEVASLLKVSRQTVSTWAQDGTLRGHKVGSAWRFWRRDVMTLLGDGPTP